MLEPKGIALAVALVVAFGVAIKWGESIGETNVREEVAQEKLATANQINKLQDEIKESSLVHSREMQEIRDGWTEAQLAYQLDLAGITADYNKRLLLSQTRAGIYQRQAKGSAVEQERLAAHAAELDRTVEEGRQLVGELKATLGQRDSAIRALGSIILTDRKFFSPE